MNALHNAGRAIGLACVFVSTLFAAPLHAEERVTFNNAQGDRIDAVYIPAPADKTKPTPAVVMLHGCAGLFTKKGEVRARERAWAKILYNEGWAVLMPDSFGSRGFGSLCRVKNRPVKPEDQRPFDAVAAIKFLSENPDIDAKRIAILGWSNGAMTGLHTVRKGADAEPAQGDADARTAVVFYPGCISLKKSYPDYQARIPTLIQHGEKDDWTLAKPCQELVHNTMLNGNGAPMFIDIYPDSYHNFDHPNSKLRTITTKHSGYASGERQVHIGTNPEAREKAIARTLEWFRAHLGDVK